MMNDDAIPRIAVSISVNEPMCPEQLKDELISPEQLKEWADSTATENITKLSCLDECLQFESMKIIQTQAQLISLQKERIAQLVDFVSTWQQSLQRDTEKKKQALKNFEGSIADLQSRKKYEKRVLANVDLIGQNKRIVISSFDELQTLPRTPISGFKIYPGKDLTGVEKLALKDTAARLKYNLVLEEDGSSTSAA